MSKTITIRFKDGSKKRIHDVVSCVPNDSEYLYTTLNRKYRIPINSVKYIEEE